MGKILTDSTFGSGLDVDIVTGLNNAIGTNVFTRNATDEKIVMYLKRNYVVKTHNESKVEIWDYDARDNRYDNTIYGASTGFVTQFCGSIGYWHRNYDPDDGRTETDWRPISGSEQNGYFGYEAYRWTHHNYENTQELKSEFPIDFSRYISIGGTMITEQDDRYISGYTFTIQHPRGTDTLSISSGKYNASRGWWSIDLTNINISGYLIITKNRYSGVWIEDFTVTKADWDFWEVGGV